MCGGGVRSDWRRGKGRPFERFGCESEALAALAASGAPVERLQVIAPAGPAYHPGRSGKLCLGPKQVLAEFGELHPSVARAFDLKGTVAAAEVYLDAVPARRESGRARPESGRASCRERVCQSV